VNSQFVVITHNKRRSPEPTPSTGSPWRNRASRRWLPSGWTADACETVGAPTESMAPTRRVCYTAAEDDAAAPRLDGAPMAARRDVHGRGTDAEPATAPVGRRDVHSGLVRACGAGLVTRRGTLRHGIPTSSRADASPRLPAALALPLPRVTDRPKPRRRLPSVPQRRMRSSNRAPEVGIVLRPAAASRVVPIALPSPVPPQPDTRHEADAVTPSIASHRHPRERIETGRVDRSRGATARRTCSASPPPAATARQHPLRSEGSRCVRPGRRRDRDRLDGVGFLFLDSPTGRTDSMTFKAAREGGETYFTFKALSSARGTRFPAAGQRRRQDARRKRTRGRARRSGLRAAVQRQTAQGTSRCWRRWKPAGSNGHGNSRSSARSQQPSPST